MDNNPPESDLTQQHAAAIPIPDAMHKKQLPRKIPPHMRRLNMRFSSPSDNLSPMSQKLMLADRNNAAAKSIRPKALQEVFMSYKQQDHGSGCESAIDMSGQEDTNGLEELDDKDMDPPSPTKAGKIGGMVTL